jgi:protein-disulfide isomerase/uncharacterized membrane protein
MSARSRALLLSFALLGLAASLTSSYVHYRLLTTPTYTSFCDVSATVSCTQAYLSQYGSFLGVPVAILGAIFFTVILLMVVFAPKPRVVPAGKKVRAADAATVSGESVPAYIFALSAVALAFAVYLAWASLFQLGAVCILCAITYVAIVGLFVVAWQASPVPMNEIPRRAVTDVGVVAKRPAALAIAVLLLAASSMAIVSFPHETTRRGATGTTGQTPAPQHAPLTDGQRQQFEQWYDVQPVVPVPIDRGTAKVVIVKFNDFQCPPCRQTYYDYQGILAKYTASGAVKFVLKHFPLESECNTKDLGHTGACESAAAYLMAEKKGTGAKLEEWLFANQGPPTLSPQQVRRAAAEVGGIGDFDAQYAEALKHVRADVQLGDQLGAESTPTFFINGHRIKGGLPAAAFEAAIELELKRAR